MILDNQHWFVVEDCEVNADLLTWCKQLEILGNGLVGFFMMGNGVNFTGFTPEVLLLQ